MEEIANDRLEHIEKEASALGDVELAEFRKWFAEFDAMTWDEKLEADVSSGKLDRLANEALAALQSGKVREI